jgi:FkbM family methyltransferase
VRAVAEPLSPDDRFLHRAKRSTKKFLRAGFNTTGYDIVRYRPRDAFARRRQRLLDAEGVDVVLDVGANAGQYGSVLREHGFRGRVVSFEPVAAAFDLLSRRATADGNWECHRLALAAEEGERTIHVSENLVSSSFLPLGESFVDASPGLRYVTDERVPTARLDDVRPRLQPDTGVLFLKLDVQGFELDVLQGAEETLGDLAGLECELSLTGVYRDQTLLADVVALLARHGLHLCAIEPAFVDARSGDWLQLDGLFARALPPSGVSKSADNPNREAVFAATDEEHGGGEQRQPGRGGGHDPTDRAREGVATER